MKKKHKILNGGQKKTVFGWSKGKKGNKGSSKSKNNLPEGDSRTNHQERVQMMNTTRTKGRGKDQKRKGKESSFSPIRTCCLGNT